MSFSGWLRRNAEHYLLAAAQDRVATAYEANHPRRPHGPVELFWRRVFTPIYARLPWGLRRRVMVAMPGSHRKSWKWEQTRRGPAV